MWHLATNNLAGRPLRTTLLVGAIIASVALMMAVSSMLETVDRSHRQTLGRMFGLGQLRITHRYQQRVSDTLIDQARAWPGVSAVSPRFEHSLSLEHPPSGQRMTIQAVGIEPDAHERLRPAKLSAGRMIRQPGEIVLDSVAMEKLGASLGQTLKVIHFGPPTAFTVVGVIDRPRLGILQRPTGFIELAHAQRLAGLPGWVDDIEILLSPHQDIAAMVEAHQGELPAMATLQTTASASAGMTRGIEAARLLLTLIGGLVGIAGSFIIATSLTTAVTERLREMAILRSVGATRFQVATSQLASGVILTAGATLAGIPIGIALAYGAYRLYHDRLPGGFDPAWEAVGLILIMAMLSGLLAAAYPAVMASRVSPVEGLAARARKPSWPGVAACLALGLAFTLAPMMSFALPVDAQHLFWFFIIAGMPMVLVGFFLLSVPVVLAVSFLLHRPMGRLLGVPGALLAQGVSATPYRSGFTAGALMIALGLLVNIWMGGRSFLAGWFDQIRIPDAFVHSATPIPPDRLEALRVLPFVTDLCPVTAFPVPTAGVQFGVKRYAPRQTLYVACDVASFVRMSNLMWVQGDEASALQELAKGQAILVSQEFRAVHGIGVGDELTLQTRLGDRPFRVAGVVASPGIDVATQFYGIGRNYASASVGSVIGTNADAIRFWDVDAANLVLMAVKPGVADSEVLWQIREAVPNMVRSSARKIRQQVREEAGRLMEIASFIALMGLAIACLGVGNLILAGIHARRFEFGVLRAIGGGKAMLARLILGQTLLIALAAGALGVAMGIEATAIGQRFHQKLMGIEYPLVIPWDVAAWGAVAICVAALLAATPAAMQVWRAHPRDLLVTE